LTESLCGPVGGSDAGAIELPWASLPLAESLPRIPDAADFVRSYGLAVHLHDLVSRLTAVSPAEARRLLLQGR
jgi:hypothetical protein